MGSILRTPSRLWARSYATAIPSLIVGARSPSTTPMTSFMSQELDDRILSAAPPHMKLPRMLEGYAEHSGRILPISLPYESRPDASRRCDFGPASNSVVNMIAHYVKGDGLNNVTVCSAFALSAASDRDRALILTCAHTLEEIRHKSFLHLAEECPGCSSGTFVISNCPDSTELTLEPIHGVESALLRADLLLLSKKGPAMRSLPLSPYPAHPGTAIRAHLVSHAEPDGPDWMPWIGGTWSKWARGKILGYRDSAGREAQPGTYDALSHLYFEPQPTAGSSGGPIVDEESGAVVGIMLGTRMENCHEGVRGYGVPAETVYEMFSLPGLEGKR